MATIQQLTATYAERKQALEHLWSRDGDGEPKTSAKPSAAAA